MASFVAGEIVIVDWRDVLPREPNKRRPAVVVEDHELFDAAYPNVILVPLTEDERLAIADLSAVIDPAAENGCTLLRSRPLPCGNLGGADQFDLFAHHSGSARGNSAEDCALDRALVTGEQLGHA